MHVLTAIWMNKVAMLHPQDMAPSFYISNKHNYGPDSNSVKCRLLISTNDIGLNQIDNYVDT